MTIETNKLSLLAEKLEIVIITYNRAKFLISTLKQIEESPFSRCKVTVLDNKSTDSTVRETLNIKPNFRELVITTNKVNIGANANVIRAFETSNSHYTWVLCDDDKYDFSYCEDVIDAIINEEYNLIHMGAHEEYWKFCGISATPRDLVSRGYPYFKYSSFLPCNILRTEFFYKSIIKAYSNIVNWYPHMPCLIELYETDELVYIAKNRIVTAVIGNQDYFGTIYLEKWFNCAHLLNKRKDKLILQLSQSIILKNDSTISWNRILFSYGLYSLYKGHDFRSTIRLFSVTNSFQTLILLISILLSPFKFAIHILADYYRKAVS